jgi:multiple sugar transport system ATP-binding protein
VRDPKVFLFDEPLSNLDAKLRVDMRTEIKKLHQRVATTVVYVTHDQVEAMTLADRIVLMRAGVIEQLGTPDEIYNAPASTYAAGFIGSPRMNLIPATLVPPADGAGLAVRFGDGRELPLPAENRARYAAHAGRRVIFGLRPENLGLQHGGSAAPDGGAGSAPKLEVTAEVVETLGSDTLVFFRLGDTEAVARVPPGHVRGAGEAVTLYPDLARMHLFDPATERAIEGPPP